MLRGPDKRSFPMAIELPPLPYAQDALMQEIRFSSKEEGFTSWIAGVFFADMDLETRLFVPVPGINAICGNCSGDPDGEEVLADFLVDDSRSETGVFADVTFNFSEKWQGSIGARWYDIEREFKQVGTGFFSALFEGWGKVWYAECLL